MLDTLGFTGTEHWEFFLEHRLKKRKNQRLKMTFQNQLVNVQSTYTVVYVVCLQCSIKKWSWQVLIGNCSNSQPLNFDRLVTN